MSGQVTSGGRRTATTCLQDRCSVRLLAEGCTKGKKAVLQASRQHQACTVVKLSLRPLARPRPPSTCLGHTSLVCTFRLQQLPAAVPTGLATAIHHERCHDQMINKYITRLPVPNTAQVHNQLLLPRSSSMSTLGPSRPRATRRCGRWAIDAALTACRPARLHARAPTNVSPVLVCVCVPSRLWLPKYVMIESTVTRAQHVCSVVHCA